MFKNILILLLLTICIAQSYIIYTHKSENWLQHSVDQAKDGFESFVNPGADAESKPVATTTISQNNNSQTSTSKTNITKQPEQNSVTTVKTTIEKSVAFEHLKTNVNCSEDLDEIEKIICQDVDLIDQDKRLNFILRKWNSSNANSSFKIASQDDWLNLRKQTCSNATNASMKSCIKELTEKRIQAVTGQI